VTWCIWTCLEQIVFQWYRCTWWYCYSTVSISSKVGDGVIVSWLPTLSNGVIVSWSSKVASWLYHWRLLNGLYRQLSSCNIIFILVSAYSYTSWLKGVSLPNIIHKNMLHKPILMTNINHNLIPNVRSWALWMEIRSPKQVSVVSVIMNNYVLKPTNALIGLSELPAFPILEHINFGMIWL